MPICVLKGEGTCVSSRENEARFLHLNEVKFARLLGGETKWPPINYNLDLFRMHLHRKRNANTKLDLQSPIVDRNKYNSVLCS